MTLAQTDHQEGLLAELAAALVRDCRSLAILGWPDELLNRCLDSVDQLADEAARRRHPGIRQVALDLYAYLVGVVERQPSMAARADGFLPLVQQLADAVAQGLATEAPSLAYIDLLSAREKFPPALAAAFEQAGYALRHFNATEQLAEASRLTPAAALFVEAGLLREACAELDGLAAQVPATGSTVVIAFGGDRAGDRLELLLQGATLHAPRLVEDGLAGRVLELLHHSRDQPYRVLVVDDDANSREYLRLVLEQGGIEVESCADGTEVPARLAANPPDLLLLDLHMPRIDGLGLTLRLRRQPEHALLPIVLVSGEEREQVRSQAIQSGADDFLRKPVRPRVLLAEVRSRIKRARLVRQQLPAATRVPLEHLRGQLRRGDFLRQLAQVMHEPGSGWTALLSIRVDQAEKLGKSLGQSTSYELERAIAERFSAELGAEDAYTLWLEFGFGVLARRDSREELQALATRLCGAIARRPFEVHGQVLALTVSIGMALPPAHGAADPDRWFAAAYAGMSVAHRLGGNRYDGVLSREHGDMPAERVLLIRELARDAARGEHIVNEFQPMLPLRSGEGGAYALTTQLRDYRAPLSGIRRRDYLAAAREAGSLAMIERAALFSAFEAIRAERDSGRRTQVLVPVDLASLDHAQLAWLAAERRRRGNDADCLVVEIDAAELLAKPHLRPVMQQLKDAGLRLCIAESSGGLSLVEQLLPLPADLLRLPQEAIDGVAPEAFAAMIAGWQGRGRGLVVDAVRNLDTVQELWALGIDYLLGDALATSGPRLDYDFGQVMLASGQH
jgi:PleD family two-component response regulator/EAL domain-containing protein (putative c-di-GMP-specific phosphodiesterase class I)